MKLLQLILYIAAALVADFFKVLLAFTIHALTLTIHDYQTKKYLEVAQMVPWDALIFGFTFGLVAFIFNRKKMDSGITKDDYLAFVFICPLVQVISHYLEAITGQALSSFSLNPFYVFSFLSALFIALVAEKGLFLKLNFFGVVLVGALGALIHLVSPYLTKYFNLNLSFLNFPLSLSFFWYTVIGTTMAILSLLQEESLADNIDRDNLATINKLRKLY